jgi:hypothetical protein
VVAGIAVAVVGIGGREAAKRFAEAHGLLNPLIVTMEQASPEHSYFVAYGHSQHSVDVDAIHVEELSAKELSREDIEASAKKLGRKMDFWPGTCMVHETFSAQKIAALKAKQDVRVITLGDKGRAQIARDYAPIGARAIAHHFDVRQLTDGTTCHAPCITLLSCVSSSCAATKDEDIWHLMRSRPVHMALPCMQVLTTAPRGRPVHMALA